MNLILFNSPEEAAHIASDDPRAEHIRKVLRTEVGQQIFVGVLNGARGAATLTANDDNGLHFDIRWEKVRPPLHPVHLLIALPRPQTARKILNECTTLGVARIDFYQSERGERSYAQSSLWNTQEWKRHLMQGAEQAFCTRLPEVTHFNKLTEALDAPDTAPTRLALDNYEAPTPLSQHPLAQTPVQLIFGGERGFSASERDQLRTRAIPLCHLGERVLRTETAALAASSLVLAGLGVI